MIETLNVLEENKGYWESRDLSAIPEQMLDKIGDLGEVIVHEPDLNHLFEPPKQLLKSLEDAKNACMNNMKCAGVQESNGTYEPKSGEIVYIKVGVQLAS